MSIKSTFLTLEKGGTSCPNWGQGGRGGGVQVIWTKSKRTATFFFGKPSLSILFKENTKRGFKRKRDFHQVDANIAKLALSRLTRGGQGRGDHEEEQEKGLHADILSPLCKNSPFFTVSGVKVYLDVDTGSLSGHREQIQNGPFQLCDQSSCPDGYKTQILCFKAKNFACNGKIKRPRCFIV